MRHSVHITTVHLPFDNRILYKECRTLCDNGYKVSIIAQHAKAESVYGAEIIPLPFAKNRVQRICGLVPAAFLKSMKLNADIYHIHDPELLAAGLLLKLLKRKPVIYDVHEDYKKQILIKEYIPAFMRRGIAAVFDLTEKLFSRFFDGIIAADENIAKKFRSLKNIVTVLNYPLRDMACPNRDEGAFLKNGTFTLVYVGKITEMRGITQVARALEIIPNDKNIKFKLCGRICPEGYERELRKLKAWERIEYAGWMKPTDIAEILHECDIGISCLLPAPNYLESVPTKLFEYMMAALPVIASNFPALKEIVDVYKCGLTVDPLIPDEIAGAIEYLIAHPREARAMGENGRRIVSKKFSWESEKVKLMEFYGNICGR